MAREQGSREEPSYDGLVEAAARLAQSDDEMRWALIQARKDVGLSQRELAEVIGVKQSTIAAFESQENDPRLSTHRRYALAVGASLDHRVQTSTGRVFSSDGWTEIASGCSSTRSDQGASGTRTVKTRDIKVQVSPADRMTTSAVSTRVRSVVADRRKAHVRHVWRAQRPPAGRLSGTGC